MKLHSHEKLKDVQLRITINEKIAGLLAQYVVYANTQLGHNFADVKELTAEVLRAFVEEDRGFKAWLHGGPKDTTAITLTPQGAVHADLTVEHGLRNEQTSSRIEGTQRVGAK